MSFDLLAEMRIDGYVGKRVASTRGGEWAGACIYGCDGLGKDRLRVQPHYGNYGFFECRVCGAKGSGVDHLMIKRNIPKIEALRVVGWTPKDGSELKCAIPTHILAERTPSTHDAPCHEWQNAGQAFVEYCEKALWSDAGRDALKYLHDRGLRDESIKLARIGYNPREMYRDGQKWGRKGKMHLPKGIVISWIIGGELWRITVRDESVADGDDGRYKQIAGGSNGLYLADFLHLHPVVIVCEGEFDALSVNQECGKSVVAMATGTTSGSHTTRWLAELARKDSVYIAFDAERDKGDIHANWWLKRLENAQRLRPWWSDANQMLQDGVDLKEWIQPCLGPEYMDALNFCSVCHGLTDMFTDDGVPFCIQHAPKPLSLQNHCQDSGDSGGRSKDEIAQYYDDAFPEWRVTVLSRDEWLQQKAKRQPSRVCNAVWWINAKGASCKVWDKPVKEVECGGTQWVKVDGEYICAKCYSPLPYCGVS